MCGILGWAGAGRPGFSKELFERALARLQHRGPDDVGTWASEGVLLGHRRLSIIDLSAAGHQPMSSATERTQIVFNGEIYNYVELRNKLIACGRSVVRGSDTGVLIEALEAWGTDILPQLNGMWSFGTWSAERKQLLICRDRFGVKPLYYHLDKEGIAFASEPKALLELFPENRRINRNTLLEFLAYNQLFVGAESFYEGIHVLPPAHYAIYDVRSGSLRMKRYWDYPIDTNEDLTAGDAVEGFQQLFNEAVRIRLRSDVPVGLTLSGGLDSSAILSSASKESEFPPRCFTSTYSDSDVGELRWAELATRSVGAQLTEVPAVQEDWLKGLRDVVWYMDSPGYSPAVYPLWCLMQQARAVAVPVLLEGQGADEALGGYPQYSILEFLDFARGCGEPRSPKALYERFAGMRGTFSMRWAVAWLAREVSPLALRWHRSRVGFQSLLRPDVALPPIETRGVLPAGDRVRQRLSADHARDILPGLLHYGDAISMAHSIEARNPFLDYRLVEWMFRLPTKFKLRRGQTKWVLREYLRGSGMRAIGDRRDKRGYPTPTGAWLASDLGRELEGNLLKKPSPLHEWIEPVKLKRLFDLHRSGAIAAEHHLYKLLSAQMWIDRCIGNGNA